MKKMAEIRFGFVFFVLFSLLVSCGENDKSLVDMASSLSVESVAELPRCSKIFEGKTADVDEGGSSYVCRNGKWIQAATNYKTEKDMPECTKKREGSVAFIEEAGVLKTCINEKWKLSSEIEALSSGTDDKDGVSSSVNNTGSSASSVSSSSFIWDEDEGDTRQVRFEAGVLWKPGYGQRVRTFNSEADEYTFFNDKTTNDWWRTSSDMDNSGQSMALFKVGSDYATISTDLVYGNWKKGPDGLNVASSSVYAAAGFNWAAKGYADISEEKGVCFVYTSGKDFRVELVSKGDPWDYWNAWVPASSKKKTANLKFSNLSAAWWQENSATLSKALTQMAAMNFESPYINSTHCFETDSKKCKTMHETNTVKIYMIAEYGKCPKNDDIELGTKAVEFEKGIMWKPSYGEKARSFFGDVNEYNFYSSDPSGWWYTYDDTDSKGSSTAKISFEKDYLQATLTNNDNDLGYAYAAFGFELTFGYKEKGFVDLTSNFGKGICMEYSSEYDFDFKLHSNVDSDQFWYLVPASSAKRVIDIEFENYTDYDWQTNEGSLNSLLQKASSFHFEFAPRHVEGYKYKTNTIKVYKVGKYGSCD